MCSKHTTLIQLICARLSKNPKFDYPLSKTLIEKDKETPCFQNASFHSSTTKNGTGRREIFDSTSVVWQKTSGATLSVYRVKSAEECLRTVLIQKHCPNCLRPFYKLEICTSKKRCQRCGEKHHTTLHMVEKASNPTTVEVVDKKGIDESILSIGNTDRHKSRVQEEEDERIVKTPLPSGGST